MKCFESYFDARKKFGIRIGLHSEEIIGKTGEQKKSGKRKTENEKKEKEKKKKEKKKKRKNERRKFF